MGRSCTGRGDDRQGTVVASQPRAEEPCTNACRHARVIEGETSRFYLCEVSVINPAYPKYPVLPVLRSVGYKPVAAGFAYDGDDPQ